MSHVLDTVITTVAPIVVAAVAVLADVTTPTPHEDLYLLLLPLIGALVASGSMIMLNPELETRRIVIGRSMLALLGGMLGPQLIALVHPNIAAVAIKPVVLIFLGAAVAVFVYVLSKPFTRELYARAAAIARTEADRLQSRLMPISTTTTTVRVEETKPAPIAPAVPPAP